jgi:hypothetical protein
MGTFENKPGQYFWGEWRSKKPAISGARIEMVA